MAFKLCKLNPLTNDSPISDLERTLDTICSFPLRCMQQSTARKEPSPLASPSPSTATQITKISLIIGQYATKPTSVFFDL